MAAPVDASTSAAKEPKALLVRLLEPIVKKGAQIIELLRMQTELMRRTAERRAERQLERQSTESWVLEVPLRDLCEDDDILAFLHTAERVMRLCSVQPEQWAELIAPYLTGKAKQAYRALGEEDRIDYEAVKKAVLWRYKIANGTYRCLFTVAVNEKAAREARWEASEKQDVAAEAAMRQAIAEAEAERQALYEAVEQALEQAAAEEAAETQAARKAAELTAAREAAEQAAAREAAEQAAAKEAAEKQAARDAAEEALVAEEAAASTVKYAAVKALSAAEAAAATSETEAATTDAATEETVATDIVAASKVAGIEDVAASNRTAAAREAPVPARASKDALVSYAKWMVTVGTAPVTTTVPDAGLGPRAAVMRNQNASVTAFVTEAVAVTRAMASGATRLLAKTCHSVVKKPALAPRRQPAVT